MSPPAVLIWYRYRYLACRASALSSRVRRLRGGWRLFLYGSTILKNQGKNSLACSSGQKTNQAYSFAFFLKISLQVCMTKPLPVTSHWMRTPKTTRLGQSPRSSQLNQQKSGSTFPLTWAHTQMAIFIFSTK